MAAAAAGLAEDLDRAPFRDARCPILANVSATPVRGAAEIRAALKAQLLGAVRWEATMRWLVEHRVAGCVEIGTGKVLRGLLRSLDKAAPSWNVDDPESLDQTLAALGAKAVAGEGR
jgi:[acyl-carrier-protein] S-malonyltransferase